VAYVKGKNRNQITLFPEVIDDYITEENQVRFIDAFVESLNLINFKYGQTKYSGRPPYNPKDLLKLYIYGYLNNIRSSSKLEKETHRNIEVFWLIQKLQPDHKTISNFRQDNKKLIKQVFKKFTVICKNLELFGGELIAVDGSKFEAVNSNNRAFTKTKLQEKIKEIEKYIDEYFEELDKNDDEESGIKDFTKKELKEEINSLQKRKEEYEKLQEQLENSGNTQICLTDSDSRLMRTGHNGKDVCYNVQVAADEKHNLIVDYEVTNHENDLNELSNISIKAKETLEVEEIETLADVGYYNGKEIKKCFENGITPYVSKPKSSGTDKKFNKSKFKYYSEKDVYVCPNDSELKFKKKKKGKNGEIYKVYRGKNCNQCKLKEKCTKSKTGREVRRWEHEEILDEMAKRYELNKEKTKKRKHIIEPVFGCLKRNFNQGYMLLKGIPEVSAEFSLSALAYNIKRVENIVGIKKLIKATV